MVNLFPRKNKQKADVATEDPQVRPQGSASSGSTARKGASSAGLKNTPKDIDELPQLRDYPAAKYMCRAPPSLSI